MNTPTEEALDQLLDLAECYGREDRDVLALELLARYLKWRPADTDALFLYADCLRIVGRRGEAELEFLKLLELRSQFGAHAIHSRLAMLYDDSGQRTLAEEHWQSACNCHNAPGWSWILRGANLASLEKFEEAEACYQLASQKDDGVQDEAYLNIGRAMRARGKYVDAEAAFQKALESTPDYEEAWVGMRSIEGLAEALVATNQLLCNRLK